MAVGPTASRLKRLERRLGVDQVRDDDDGDFELIPVETWIEGWRDLMEIHAGWAQGSDHWRRVYEEWLPRFEEVEQEAAAVGPGGVIWQKRWLSEGAQRQIEAMVEKLRRDWGPRIDAARAERQRPNMPGREGSGATDVLAGWPAGQALAALTAGEPPSGRGFGRPRARGVRISRTISRSCATVREPAVSGECR
jgi:hypothetical protein